MSLSCYELLVKRFYHQLYCFSVLYEIFIYETYLLHILCFSVFSYMSERTVMTCIVVRRRNQVIYHMRDSAELIGPFSVIAYS